MILSLKTNRIKHELAGPELFQYFDEFSSFLGPNRVKNEFAEFQVFQYFDIFYEYDSIEPNSMKTIQISQKIIEILKKSANSVRFRRKIYLHPNEVK